MILFLGSIAVRETHDVISLLLLSLSSAFFLVSFTSCCFHFIWILFIWWLRWPSKLLDLHYLHSYWTLRIRALISIQLQEKKIPWEFVIVSFWDICPVQKIKYWVQGLVMFSFIWWSKESSTLLKVYQMSSEKQVVLLPEKVGMGNVLGIQIMHKLCITTIILALLNPLSLLIPGVFS